jgi:predicted ATPase
MAELIQVRMKDFRAFRSASLDLAPSGLNLITGPNNFGKSSLVSAFDVVNGTQMPTVRHSLGERARVWARFGLSNEERSALLEPTPDLAQLLRGGAAKWVEWEFAEIGSRMPAVAVRLNWTGDRQMLVALAEISEQGGYSLVAVPGPLSDNTELAPMGSVLGGHPADPLVDPTLRVLQPIRTVLTEWRQGFFHFSPLRQSVGRESVTSDIVPALKSDGSNLPAVLLHMYTNSPTVWHDLQRLLTGIVPGAGNLITPINQNTFQVLFSHEYGYAETYQDTYRTEYYRHNLKDLGTGVEQILMTLVVGLTQTARIVVIEEPETGLHPGAQRALLSLLQEWSRDRLFFATTHSSAMLDWSSPEKTTVYAVSRSSTESSVASVYLSGERSEVMRELGVRPSDVLSAERILIHEGPTDGRF